MKCYNNLQINLNCPPVAVIDFEPPFYSLFLSLPTRPNEFE